MFASLIASGCGDNLEGIHLGDLEATRREAQCERFVRAGLAADLASCTAVFRKSYDPLLSDEVDAGRIRFDPIAAAICV